MKSQLQMFYEAQKKIAEANELFLDLVSDGMTRKELARNIERRPELWGRYSEWLNVLPDEPPSDNTLPSHYTMTAGDIAKLRVDSTPLGEAVRYAIHYMPATNFYRSLVDSVEFFPEAEKELNRFGYRLERRICK